MQPPARNCDLFGTFLKMQRPATGAALALKSAGRPADTAIESMLLDQLGRAAAPLSLPILAARCDWGLADLMQTLAALEAIHLIARTGEGRNARYRITPLGRSLSRC